MLMLRMRNLYDGKYDSLTGAQIRELFRREDAERVAELMHEMLNPVGDNKNE